MEIELDDRTLTIDGETLHRLQAAWRGAVLRQQLAALRVDYEQLVRDIEPPGFALHLTWPERLTAPPIFTKTATPGLTVTTTSRKPPTLHARPDKTPQPQTLSVKDNMMGTKRTQCAPPTAESQKEEAEPEVVAPQKTGAKTEESEVRTGEDENSSGVGNIPCVAPEEGCEVSGSGVSSSREMRCLVSESGSSGHGPCSPGHNTTVWDTMDASKFPTPAGMPEQFDRETLLGEQNTIAMELLWIQQAIDSRKQYLRLRQAMGGGST